MGFVSLISLAPLAAEAAAGEGMVIITKRLRSESVDQDSLDYHY